MSDTTAKTQLALDMLALAQAGVTPVSAPATHFLLMSETAAERMAMAWVAAQGPALRIPSPFYQGGLVALQGDVCEVRIDNWCPEDAIYKVDRVIFDLPPWTLPGPFLSTEGE
jgi:hypothetical protein